MPDALSGLGGLGRDSSMILTITMKHPEKIRAGQVDGKGGKQSYSRKGILIRNASEMRPPEIPASPIEHSVANPSLTKRSDLKLGPE